MANKWPALQTVDSNLLSETIMITSSTNGISDTCSLMLNYKGEVFVVGRSSNGCLGLGLSESVQPIKLEELSGVAGVCVCGLYGDALAYTKEGKLFVWGKNAGSSTRPVLLPQLSDVVEASCVLGHYLALTRNGKVYEWKGVRSNLSDMLSTTPTVVPISGDIVSIACGVYHSLALTKNGDVYIWGKKFNDREYIDQPLSKISLPGETVTKIACGYRYSLVLTHSGKIFTWGCNDYGLGDARGSTESDSPVQVGESIGRFKDIGVNGWCTSAAVTDVGAVYMWGYGENDKKLSTPVLTQFTELQQVFASVRLSSYTWRCNSSVTEPFSCDSVDVESSTSIGEELKNTFNNKESSDLTLMIDNKPMYVHRFVLNLRSKYFRTLLQRHWTDQNESELVLSSYSYEVYKSYIWFLYSGEVVSTTENILELWSLADAFSEDKFKTGCENLMCKKNLTLGTMALLCSLAMTKKDVVSKVQDGSNLKEKVKKLEINIEKIQQKQESLEGNKQKLLKELEGLEEEIMKQQKEHDEADGTLLVKLKALRAQTKECKRSNENSPGNNQETLTNYEILKKNYTVLEKDKAKLYKDFEELKEYNIKIEKENKKFKEDGKEIEKDKPHVEHEDVLKYIEALKGYYKKMIEENVKNNADHKKIEEENEKPKEDNAKLKEDYKKQQEIQDKLKSVLNQFKLNLDNITLSCDTAVS